MKPEHADWIDAIWERLLLATDRAFGPGKTVEK
jgi:hypothetical protein